MWHLHLLKLGSHNVIFLFFVLFCLLVFSSICDLILVYVVEHVYLDNSWIMKMLYVGKGETIVSLVFKYWQHFLSYQDRVTSYDTADSRRLLFLDYDSGHWTSHMKLMTLGYNASWAGFKLTISAISRIALYP